MKKKFQCLLLLVVAIFATFFVSNFGIVFARDIDGTWNISESQTIGDSSAHEIINLTNITSTSAITITNNSEVEFNYVTLNFGDNITSTQLITINEGSSLILRNVTLSSDNNYTYAIVNNGTLIIDGLVIDGTFTKTIYNNSAISNSLQLYNANTMSISLEDGYVSVYEGTNISGVITIDMGSTSFSDDIIGRVLVKGRNTLASYYEDNFYLKDTPTLNDFDSGEEYIDYLALNTSYYMDYAGDVGDELPTEDDGYVISDVGNIESGDLIFTKFIVQKFNNNDQTTEYVAGKYATFDKYIENKLETYAVSTTIIDELQTSSVSSFVLNNYSSIVGSGNFSRVVQPSGTFAIIDTVQVTLNVYEGETKLSSTTVNIICSGSKAVFIDLNGYTFESISSQTSGLTIDSSLYNSKFVRPIISCPEGITSGTINIQVSTPAPVVQPVEVKIANETFEYSKADIFAQIKPYYVLNSETIYLSASEFSIRNSSGAICPEIINADTYTITLESSEDAIEFVNSEVTFVVSPKTLTITYQNEFDYDGTEKTVSASINGIIEGDTVNINFENNSLTLPGRKEIAVSIDNSNYALADDCKQVTLIVNKATVDMSAVTFEDVSGTYDPNITYRATAENVPSMVSCVYSNNEHTDVCTDGEYYLASVTFSVDEELYKPLSVTTLTAKIIISKAVIDTSVVVFEDIYHVYNGSQVILKASNIPEGVTVAYENNIQRYAKSTPYVAIVKFSINSEYSRNYTVSLSSRSANIYISKATVDFSNFKFEDTTIPYDGNEHKIYVYGLDSILTLTYLSTPHVAVGSYEQKISLSLKDSANYEPLTEDQKEMTAILTIEPATVDMSKITFEDKNVSYSAGVEHKIEISGSASHELEVTYRYYYNDQLFEGYPIDSGEYKVIADFKIKDWSVDNYYPIPSLEATLTITQLAINFKYTTLSSETFVYDGQTHFLTAKNLPSNITCEYVNNNKTDVGEYNVSLNIAYDSRNYYLINYSPLTAKLIITQADIDMSGVSFSNYTSIYDGTEKRVEITGVLPEFVEINEYVNNARKDAGTSNAMVSFTVTNANYKPVSNMYCEIKIEPRPVTVSLKQNKFTYSGNPVTVEVYVSGVLVGDSVSAEVLNATNTNASTYYAQVSGLSNSNYIVQGTASLKYEIAKADFDMTGISFGDLSIVYDGKSHVPAIEGTLPSGLIANIVAPSIVNVGTYSVYCEFNVTNNNYNSPNRLEATVTITKRPILVQFSNYTGFIEDGNEKSVAVKFIGLVDSIFTGYDISYSDTPISAGNYVCEVSLHENSNYEIIGVNSVAFEILTNTKTYVDDNYNITIEGDGFKADSVINVTKPSENILNSALGDINVRTYQALEISVSDDNSIQEIVITLDISKFGISDYSYLKVCELKNGKLVDIEFELNSNTITFTADTFDQIVILEEMDQVEKNYTWIIVSLVLAGLSLIGIAIFFILNIKSKKKK